MSTRFVILNPAVVERYWMTVKRFWGFWASWRVLQTQQIPIVSSIGATATGWMMRGGLVLSSGSSDYPLMNGSNLISKAGGMINAYNSWTRFNASLRNSFLNRYCDVWAKALLVLCEHPLKIDAAAVP